MSQSQSESARPSKKAALEAIYPLSPTQQGILFHSLLAPGSGLYVIQLQVTLQGDLVPADLLLAWESVTAWHPILRTLFVWKGRDKPLQVVSAQARFLWEEQDWQNLDETAQSERMRSFLRADRARGFELHRAPLMRLMLVRTAPQTYQLVWTYHHLLLDGWSTFRVLRQVLDTYAELRQWRTLPMETSRPYRDYVAWVQNQDLTQAEAFWRQMMKGLTPPAPLGRELPKRSDPSSGAVQGRREKTLDLSLERTATLQAMARRYRLTLNTIVQGAWGLLLSHHTGEPDVVFGATASGRTIDMPGIENMVGLFINTLPVRIQVQPHAPLTQWLADLQIQQVQARHFEYTPLAEIQKWSQAPAGAPLFESILVFENYPAATPAGRAWGDLRIISIQSFEKTNYPLTIAIEPGECLRLRLSYDEERFEEQDICRMIDHLRTLLEGMMARPEQPLSELSSLTDSERERWLVEWNNTATDYDQAHCLHEQFEAQVERKPHAVAVEYEEQSLTFGELNRRANQLAGYLQRMGVRPVTLVGLCVERSLEMIVGLLGILKAGGALLPLDPAYPPQRIAYMLKDSRAPVVVTQERFVRRLDYTGRVVCLDAHWPAISLESEQNPPRGAVPENVAYAIYTSGSTGRPKGVLVEHHSVSNLLIALDRAVYSGEPEPRRVSLNGSLNFDTSVKQWIQLLRGRTLVIIPSLIRLDGAALLAYADAHRLDVLDCTPTQLGLILKAGLLQHQGHVPSRVLVAGEPIGAATWHELADSTRTTFYNLYGPTECTVDAAVGVIQSKQERPNIGRPIANVQLYVLNSSLQPVPIGTSGELYIGGDGLARGYLNHPDLTAERFIPNPFASRPGARLYRTGDLVRMLPEGNLEFLGRTDLQVKMRGFRIELEEIEAALKQHPKVQVAVAKIWDSGDDRRLVAYYCTDQSDIAPGELRQLLHDRLPDYMMPSVFVRLGQLPLLPNGKIDRRALPEPEDAERAPVGAFAPPRDLVELQLVQLWETALGVRPVGITDNFFDLGGHSLLALRVMAQIQQTFKQDLPLATLLQEGTVEHLAGILRREPRVSGQPRSLLVRMRSGTLPVPLFLVHPVGGNVLCYAELVRHLKSDRTVYGLRAMGLEEESEPLSSIEQMAACYVDSIRTVQPQGPYLLCGWSMGGLVAFEMAAQLTRQGCPVKMLALLDSQVPPARANRTSAAESFHHAPETELGTVADFLQELGASQTGAAQFSASDFGTLTSEQLLRRALDQAIMLGLVPPDTGVEQIRRLWRVFRSNRLAFLHYAPSAFPGKLTLFHARDNGLAVKELGWEQVAQQPIEVHPVPGEHRTMLSQPHARTLAEELQACIDEADRG